MWKVSNWAVFVFYVKFPKVLTKIHIQGVSEFLGKKNTFYIHKEDNIYIPQTIRIHKQTLGTNRGSTSETIKIERFF